jgi:hypothetical protein
MHVLSRTSCFREEEKREELDGPLLGFDVSMFPSYRTTIFIKN